MAQVRKQLQREHTDPPAALPPHPLFVVETSPVAAARHPALTRREHECLGWCADGKSYWETAVILGISERTVSFHMEAVRSKLQAASNAHAVAVALRAGLLGACYLGAGDGKGAGKRPESRQGLR